MGKRVLLIDDEASIIKMVSKRLELAGYEVLTAMNGRDGLSKAQLGAPDVIILDLMMPQMSGFEICAALKKDERFKHIPIIIFTGKGQEMDERLCRELGANAYISKPHQAGALIEMIEVLLNKVLQDKPQEPPQPAP